MFPTKGIRNAACAVKLTFDMLIMSSSLILKILRVYYFIVKVG